MPETFFVTPLNTAIMLFARTALLLSVVLLTSFTFRTEKNEWKLELEKEGIKIFTKKTDACPIRTSKAETLLNLSATELTGFLLDFNNYPKWFPSCKNARLLKRISDTEFIAHLEYKTPWPLPNLDCVEHVWVEKNAETGLTLIRMAAEPDNIPVIENSVRIRLMQDTWRIQSLKEGVMVSNEYFTDMGGVLPYWLANTQMVEIPYNIFTKMRKAIHNTFQK